MKIVRKYQIPHLELQVSPCFVCPCLALIYLVLQVLPNFIMQFFHLFCKFFLLCICPILQAKIPQLQDSPWTCPIHYLKLALTRASINGVIIGIFCLSYNMIPRLNMLFGQTPQEVAQDLFTTLVCPSD